MEFELPKDRSSIIKVIGVGGGGSNAVNHMYRQGIEGVDFIVCNTDQQALDVSPVPHKVQLGTSLTEGRGAGSLPEVGKNAAIENADDVKEFLKVNTKMVFITAGMGGGTGTGAAPVIAGIAKELGILTVGIVTMPFSFEGRKREQQAREGLEQLKKNVDTILIIRNDKLRETHGNLKLTDAFAQADNILTVAAKSIAEIITKTYNMNVDFADVNTVMSSSGVAIMGSATAEGDNRSMVAVQKALESPLLNDNNIEGARYILLNIVSGSREVTMDEFDEITSFVQEAAGHTAELIIGNGIDEELGEKLAVTIIATGFKTSMELGVEKKNNERIVRRLDEPVAKAIEPEAPKREETLFPESVVEALIVSEPIAEVSEEMVLFTKEVVEEKIQPIVEFEIRNQPSKVIAEEAAPVPAPVAQPVMMKLFDDPKPMVSQQVNVQPVVNQVINNGSTENTEDLAEQLKRSKERIARLRELSMKLKTPGGINDMEKVPAYVRKNIELDNKENHSRETVMSRYTLSDDENGKPEIRSNNSFLHDNVD